MSANSGLAGKPHEDLELRQCLGKLGPPWTLVLAGKAGFTLPVDALSISIPVPSQAQCRVVIYTDYGEEGRVHHHHWWRVTWNDEARVLTAWAQELEQTVTVQHMVPYTAEGDRAWLAGPRLAHRQRAVCDGLEAWYARVREGGRLCSL